MFLGCVRVLTTHSIRQFPLHFPSRASQCAITFQLDSTCPGVGRCGTTTHFVFVSVEGEKMNLSNKKDENNGNKGDK